MCYCKRKKCGWNNTHTSGFHAEWKRDPSALCILVDHDYWKFSGNATNHGTTGGSSGGGGNQDSDMDY